MNATQPVGQLLREWRTRRRLSQLDFATEAEISSKHLSFLETGRSQPSRDMLLHLAELLDVPLRERNSLLVAAGFAPMFGERSLSDPELSAAREAVDLLLKAHEPFPALAIDRHWTMLSANRTVAALLGDVAPELVKPPVNVLRLSLHPEGFAPRIVNLPQWRAHLFARLRRQIDVSGDSVLIALMDELTKYPAPERSPSIGRDARLDANAVVVPFQLTAHGQILSFISTTTVFGTPIDVTLSELALETFFPADATTAAALRAIAGG
jgi:transcriptional regulator with XRE-family HTH domain